MRILVHDYSGHPFQVQLTRELARRGWEARHIFSASFQTPKGKLVKTEDDVDTLSIVPIMLQEPFQKYSFVRRRSQEIEQGRLIGRQIRDFQPDIVISSNAPLDTQRYIWRECHTLGIPKIFWVQDIYSEAISRMLRQKSRVLSYTIGRYYEALESRLLREAEHIVSISDAFVPLLEKMSASTDNISVIENWAPLDELDSYPRENSWTLEKLNSERRRFVYSGTIGFKHNPEYLLALAERFPSADVLVCSEGSAVDWLKRESRVRNISNIILHPWVDYADLPKMLSGADILVVLLEEDAGVFSVPSKILTYCTVGRAILGSIPEGNLGRLIVEENKIGLISSPNDKESFLLNAAILLSDSELRSASGYNGRRYAQEKFNIEKICDKFERLLNI